MSSAENRQKLYERMCQNMQNDRAKHNILPLSKFGLMQITRQRVRPAMNISVEEECPTCGGTGKIKASLLFIDMIEHKIELLSSFIKNKSFYLHVHPFVEAYINKGFFSRKLFWKFKFGFGLHIVPNQKLSFLEYKFYDKQQNEINLKEENEMQ
jgi:ribonuclease G